MKQFSLIVLIFLLVGSSLNAQDFVFNQFSASPITLNPAMTGMMNGCSRIATNYQHRVPDRINSNSFMAIAYDKKMNDSNSQGDFVGLGFLFTLNQNAYDSNRAYDYTLLGSAAFHKSLGTNSRYFLSFGVQAGLGHKSYEYAIQQMHETFRFYNFFWTDSFLNYSKDNLNHFNLDIGGMFTASPSDKIGLFVGASITNLASPSSGFFHEYTSFLKKPNLSMLVQQ